MDAMTVVLLAVLVFGINTAFWTLAGIHRYMSERQADLLPRRLRPLPRRRPKHLRSAVAMRVPAGRSVSRREVAVLIAARNEAAVLQQTLAAASQLLPRCNIHVVSDGSTDRTADIARRFGVHVLELNPNRGKAGALDAAIRHFALARNFRVMLLLDADTRLASDYLDTGLPAFDDPDVVAVAGSVRCLLDPPPRTLIGQLLVAYRARLYVVVQLLTKYGQASPWANVVSIVPGFASMYRTDILEKIDIAAPGLVIEDFNMTFEVHAKQLGRVAFDPRAAVAYTQDPDSVQDYVRQIRRWSLGFWQTVRRHGLHRGRFWLVVAAQCVESVSSSIILLSVFPLLIFGLYSQNLAATYGSPEIGGMEVVGTLTPLNVLLGFAIPDVLLTVLAAVALRRPSLLAFAPVLPIMRLVDAYVCLRTLALAYHTTSTGRWLSPARRGTPEDAKGSEESGVEPASTRDPVISTPRIDGLVTHI